MILRNQRSAATACAAKPNARSRTHSAKQPRAVAQPPVELVRSVVQICSPSWRPTTTRETAKKRAANRSGVPRVNGTRTNTDEHGHLSSVRVCPRLSASNFGHYEDLPRKGTIVKSDIDRL